MVQKIEIDNIDWPLEKILQQVGDEFNSVVKLEGKNGIDVMVISHNEWQHILELLGDVHAQGYRISDELPPSVRRQVNQPKETIVMEDLSTDQSDLLYPEADFELEAGEIAESDDILD